MENETQNCDHEKISGKIEMEKSEIRKEEIQLKRIKKKKCQENCRKVQEKATWKTFSKQDRYFEAVFAMQHIKCQSKIF